MSWLRRVLSPYLRKRDLEELREAVVVMPSEPRMPPPTEHLSPAACEFLKSRGFIVAGGSADDPAPDPPCSAAPAVEVVPTPDFLHADIPNTRPGCDCRSCTSRRATYALGFHRGWNAALAAGPVCLPDADEDWSNLQPAPELPRCPACGRQNGEMVLPTREIRCLCGYRGPAEPEQPDLCEAYPCRACGGVACANTSRTTWECNVCHTQYPRSAMRIVDKILQEREA